MNFADYDAPRFNCYGTLIDWETASAQCSHRGRQRWASWPAFPDSAAALQTLAGDHVLIIVSNVHREDFAGSNIHLGVDFDRIITAEDVGAYKPAANHFEALDVALRELDVPRERLLHVAQSLFHDHVPARRHGLDSVWINRRHNRPGWGPHPCPYRK